MVDLEHAFDLIKVLGAVEIGVVVLDLDLHCFDLEVLQGSKVALLGVVTPAD